MEEPQHWPTERMIEEHHDAVVPQDLETLDDDELLAVANICLVAEMLPDECIPCLALTLLDERNKAEEVEESIPDEEVYDEDGEFKPTPKLAALMATPPPWEEEVPVAQQFAAKVRELDALVAQLVEGPPIPPPNVSVDELGLLVVATQRWIALMDAQGIELATSQQQILDATRALVSRLHHG